MIIPKVTQTINKSKDSVRDASIAGLVRTADNYYVEQIMKGNFQGCSYNFTSGINTCAGIDFSGEKPDSGILVIEKNGNIGYELYIGNSYYKKTIIPFTKGIMDGNVQYFTGGKSEIPDNVIYFDPVDGTMNCTNYHQDNSIPGFNGVTGEGGTSTTENQTSCLKWYVYSLDDNGTETEEDDVVNMILDHNTTIAIAWYNDDGNSSRNVDGPSETFKNQLATDTNGWVSDKIKTPKTFNAAWDYDENSNSVIDSGEHYNYSINYTDYNARIIEANEVARIKENISWTYTSATAGISTFNSSFLADNLSSDTNLYSYWTSSPRFNILRRAWYVNNDSYLNSRIVNDNTFGIRPVITVSLVDVL